MDKKTTEIIDEEQKSTNKDSKAPPTTQIILPGKADDRILGLVAENCPQLQVGQNSNIEHVFQIQM